MSWKQFKDNIISLSNSPEGISSIDIVAKKYAEEYDAAVKRGNDTINGISIQNGNVEAMEQLFKAALQMGSTSTEPFDLVAEMGKGVIAYWTGAVMNNIPVPTIPAPGSISNVSVVTNIVSNSGQWAPATSTSDIVTLESDIAVNEKKDDIPEIEVGSIKDHEQITGEVAKPDVESAETATETSDSEVIITIQDDDLYNIDAVIKTNTIDGITNITIPIIPLESNTVSLIKNVGNSAPPIPPGYKNFKNGTVPDDKLVGINGSSYFKLHPEAALQYNRLLTAAAKAGYKWITSSAYRDFDNQLSCFRKYGEGRAAIPGSSPHGWGVAVDISELCKMQQQKARSLKMAVAKPAPAQYVRTNSSLYKWLSQNAPLYGWYNPYRLADNSGMDESWHWEYWGFYTLTKEQRGLI